MVTLFVTLSLIKRCYVSKTVRVDEKTYRRLSEYAGDLQIKLKRPVSINEAIKYLAQEAPKNNRISDLAETWDVMDDEIDEIMRSLRKG